MNYTLSNTKNIAEIIEVFDLIKDLNQYYPKFNSWYWDKVIPGVYTGNDKIIIAKQKHEIIGISIIKKNNENSNSENKLRALRIIPRLQNKGTSLIMKLIDESFKQLDDPIPVFSIAEEMMKDMSRILVNRYGADLTQVYNSLYRKGKIEYGFNEKNHLRYKTKY